VSVITPLRKLYTEVHFEAVFAVFTELKYEWFTTDRIQVRTHPVNLLHTFIRIKCIRSIVSFGDLRCSDLLSR